jgi:hypothetical protein
LPTLIRYAAPLLALAALAGAGSACSSSESGSPTTAAPEATNSSGGPGVTVTMKEWTVSPSASTASAGPVTFIAKNEGAKTHEVALFKSDLPADQLPLDEDGAVDEAGPGVELIEEVEDVGAGETKSFSATVTAGNYYLVCNLVDADTGDKHFSHQMYAPFTAS